jgi:hypothetical protein
MAPGPQRNDSADPPALFPRPRVCEGVGLLVLAILAAYFLHLSWRKWPDPIVDTGAQWYDIWRVSQGAAPYHDFLWNYGPLSLLCNGLLFKCFGPGMMVLVAANLVVYGAIVLLAYLAFRAAWGRLAAFAALAVFISVFSFSILNGVGNYNYATPYTHEATHGILLMLVTAFVVVRWCRQASRPLAFLLGLCGGVAAVLKPEFMLAGGVLGFAGLLVRCRQRQPPRAAEYALLLAGAALPTLACAAWLARGQSWPSALVDSCQAWWLVLVDHQRSAGLVYQPAFTGLDHPWRNTGLELRAAFHALVMIATVWAAGWFVNRSWSRTLRLVTALAALAVVCSIHLDKDLDKDAGRCLPGLMAIAFVIVAARLRRELQQNGRGEKRTLMALALVLLAGAMLARMILNARINHFGFFQAALAGMVAAAVMVAEIPRWTGAGLWGRRLAAVGSLLVLGLACSSFVAQSALIRADQTQPVAAGRDRFYAFAPEVDETGLLVNWAVERLRTVPPQATLQVFPEGVMINYLSRHVRPLPDDFSDEDLYVKQLARTPPDYVIFISRDLREHGLAQFGAPGQVGEKILPWLRQNYALEASCPGRAKGATLLRRKILP